jgi:choline dehydrogenase-like flavoprotein
MPAASPDVVIIGSGMGGATIANGLAGSGARILILERGEQLAARPEARDARAIFQRGAFRTSEEWYDRAGRPFTPGNYYYAGGNTKLYGAVLTRFRERDFEAIEHLDGLSPAWPFPYGELEPFYTRAEALFAVRGDGKQDQTEPPRSGGYPFGPVPDEPAVAEVRERLSAAGAAPYTLPLGIDIEQWLKNGQTPWDSFPDTRAGKMDAETAALLPALRHANVTLETGALATRLVAGQGGRIEAVEYRKDGETRRATAKIVVLSAGAVKSAALLLASANDQALDGVANRSGMVGRNFMNHNTTILLAIDPRFRNEAIYQKTLGINRFYFGEAGGPPLGHAQLLGRLSGAILKSQVRLLPEWVLERFTRHSIDWYLVSEDLPHLDSRVTLDGDRVVVHWDRTNLAAHRRFVARMREVFRAAGFPLVLARESGHQVVVHQCGTVRMGTDPATAPLDPFCRSFDHGNLFVVDASFMPSSAALNPALTIAAQAIRVADHIRANDLAA